MKEEPVHGSGHRDKPGGGRGVPLGAIGGDGYGSVAHYPGGAHQRQAPSGAGRITVTLKVEGSDLVAEVRDDGRGFGLDMAPGVGRGACANGPRTSAASWRSRAGRGGAPACGGGAHCRGGRRHDGGNGATPIRVMLVEDKTEFRQLMEILLSRQPDLEVVAQAVPLYGDSRTRELRQLRCGSPGPRAPRRGRGGPDLGARGARPTPARRC